MSLRRAGKAASSWASGDLVSRGLVCVGYIGVDYVDSKLNLYDA